MPGLKATRIMLLRTLSLLLAGLFLLSAQQVQADTLSLTRTDFRYPLASLDYSAGFIPAKDGVALQDIQTLSDSPSEFGLNPDFRKHSRYWLHTQIVNNTSDSHWVLHVSNFGFEQPTILVRGENEQHIEILQNANLNADINTLGRAVDIQLIPGKEYTVIVELTAYKKAWDPYIALMSKQEYRIWKATTDLIYKTAIGIIIGMIILALICWLLMAEATFLWAGVSSLLLLLYYLDRSSLPAIFLNSSYEKNQLLWILVSCTILSSLAFAASFLQINRQSGFWYRAFAFTGGATLLVLVLSPILPFILKLSLYALNYLLLWTVILGSGIAKVRAAGRYYIMYIIGWMPLVLSALEVIVFIFLSRDSEREVKASYQMIESLYIQISHMMIHAVALILRVRALRQQKIQAEIDNQAKSRFIAQSSHDLRQPLYSMRLYLDSLKPYICDKEALSLFDGLNKNHRQLEESFSSILDLNKLEAGVLTADKKAVAISSIFSRLQYDFQIQAKNKGLKLSIHPCSATVYSDPVLLERMLRNLIANAIKYTDSGRVIIGCRRRQNHISIQVLDSGSGIAPHEQKIIFDLYQRSESVLEKPGGTGIGLSVVKHLSELLGHPLALDSVVGKGSRFSITVPCANSDEEVATTLFPDHSEIQATLFFKDKELQEATQQHLHNWGVTVYSVNNTEQLANHNSAALIIFDQAALADITATGDLLTQQLSENITACVLTESASRPTLTVCHCQILSAPLLPTQLRALVNYASRESAKADTRGTTTTPLRPNKTVN